MYAIMYWDIGGCRIDGPFDTAINAKEHAEEELFELNANGQDYHAAVFELPDFLEVQCPEREAA